MTDWTSRYRASLAELDQYRDLVDAAVALGGHRRPELDPAAAHTRLEAIAHRVRSRVPHLAGRGNASTARAPEALMAHLHEVIFEDLGIGGHEDVAMHPDAMDLDLVLDGIPGLPVPCALVYCAAAERVGLNIFGVDVPGRFLVAIRDETSRRITVVDPHLRGQVIDGDEFRDLVQAFDETLDPSTVLKPAAPATWLRRWLRDLAIASTRSGETHLLDSWSRLSTTTEDILGDP
jgi:regulator of sirC expression with transglutaminase-like and TPR domain